MCMVMDSAHDLHRQRCTHYLPELAPPKLAHRHEGLVDGDLP